MSLVNSNKNIKSDIIQKVCDFKCKSLADVSQLVEEIKKYNDKTIVQDKQQIKSFNTRSNPNSKNYVSSIRYSAPYPVLDGSINELYLMIKDLSNNSNINTVLDNSINELYLIVKDLSNNLKSNTNTNSLELDGSINQMYLMIKDLSNNSNTNTNSLELDSSINELYLMIKDLSNNLNNCLNSNTNTELDSSINQLYLMIKDLSNNLNTNVNVNTLELDGSIHELYLMIKDLSNNLYSNTNNTLENTNYLELDGSINELYLMIKDLSNNLNSNTNVNFNTVELDSSINELYLMIKDLGSSLQNNTVNIDVINDLVIQKDLSVNGVIYHSGMFVPPICNNVITRYPQTKTVLVNDVGPITTTAICVVNYIIPQNTLKLGNSFRIKAYGERTTQGVTGLGTAALKISGVTMVALQHVSSSIKQSCIIDIMVTIKSTGNTGTARASGKILYGSSTNSSTGVLTTINTEIDNKLSLEFFSSTSSNPYVFTNAYIEQIN